MWLIIFVMTISSPILISVFQKWLKEPDSDPKFSISGPEGNDTVPLRDAEDERAMDTSSLFAPEPREGSSTDA